MNAGPDDMLLETAADWFARRRSGQFTAEDLAELRAWLDESPDHASAFREVASAWETAGAVRSNPEILSIRDEARQARPAPARRRYAAIAASLAVGLLGTGVAIRSGVVADAVALAEGRQTFRTEVGQTATVTLRDGSVVTLDTDTVLRAKETGERRSLRLERGRAFFKVAKDPARPFVVAAGGKLVTATGTAFAVKLGGEQVEVTLVEGSVRVQEKPAPAPIAAISGPAHASTSMRAGEALVASEDDQWRLAAVDTQKATSWLDGQLIFEDRPLAEAVAEINRYSRKKIVIRDRSIADAPIVSVVGAGDVDGFVRIVTAAGFARVVAETDDAIELAAAEKKIAPDEVHDF